MYSSKPHNILKGIPNGKNHTLQYHYHSFALHTIAYLQQCHSHLLAEL
ncbi:hypothetical protein HH_1119 [Helicobacter hepaticus ATCC 51449]|uniref:Uncharacterized protein n=1 Tax=Helicobacter hepaticus (strain ATCC 51449 / 3B1) TaxID=235279 RepID=Q7VH48_HELHP|nr:hypothetical protein HH_1119 [Helicobacter hepaticus ATCC 51449]